MDNKIVYQSTTDFLKFLNDRVKTKANNTNNKNPKNYKRSKKDDSFSINNSNLRTN